MDVIEADRQLKIVLNDAPRAKSDERVKLRFIEKLEHFIATASPDEKARALSQHRFATDRRSPRPGQMGFTSFWQCRWTYETDGTLTVAASHVC